ncbi:hypothetical protein B4109_0396 [Geobacillus stearothermophilus]|uniref:Uncharacterized protein n=1 Tax=Geobacillus stearothermophilus TaxID=1422 RepID=A0A150ML88_GEOSE|nr:hypothetical protein B4109_0396 [Geobacillus stearothermophilus]
MGSILKDKASLVLPLFPKWKGRFYRQAARCRMNIRLIMLIFFVF